MHARERMIGLLLLLLALMVAGGAAGYVLANWQPQIALDADHCPLSPAGTWIASIDITDAWPAAERDRIAKSLLATAERMRKNERLAIHAITGNAEDASAPRPLPGLPKGFALCKSADPKAVNAKLENERLVRATYERDFLVPLNKIIPELAKGRPSAQSPILQAIEAMLWSPHFRPDIPNRTLAIYSDLIQHTKGLSHLTGSLTDPCRVLASDIGTRLRGHDWRGVRVILEYLRNPRDAARQGAAHLRFWIHLFYLLGAAEVFDGSTLVANDTAPCRTTARTSLTPPSPDHARAHRNR